MRTSLLLAPALLAAAVATSAHASHSTADCDLVGGRVDETTTYQDVKGVLVGSIVGAPGETVSISCAALVGGVPVAGTPTSTGTTVAVTSGPVSFRSAPNAIEVCTYYTDSHGFRAECDYA